MPQNKKNANICFKWFNADDSLELLDDKFSPRVVVEIVGLEHLGREEGLQVLDGDLLCLVKYDYRYFLHIMTSYTSWHEAKNRKNKDRLHLPQRTFSIRSFSGTSMTSWSVPYLNMEVGNSDKNLTVIFAPQCEAQNLV